MRNRAPIRESELVGTGFNLKQLRVRTQYTSRDGERCYLPEDVEEKLNHEEGAPNDHLRPFSQRQTADRPEDGPGTFFYLDQPARDDSGDVIWSEQDIAEARKVLEARDKKVVAVK
jgi:hypothetical protein